MNDSLPTNGPSQTTPAQTAPGSKPIDPKIGKLKSAILYVLIGGLVISALISIVAILIGEFNSVITKALLTTFVFVTHSLIILALVSADRNNSIGKAVIPSTIFLAIIANMFTTTLGTWNVIDGDVTWRAFLLAQSDQRSSLHHRGFSYCPHAHFDTVGRSARRRMVRLILLPRDRSPRNSWRNGILVVCYI
jgi:hypothetical protein